VGSRERYTPPARLAPERARAGGGIFPARPHASPAVASSPAAPARRRASRRATPAARRRRSLALGVGVAGLWARRRPRSGPRRRSARGHSRDFFGGLAVRFQDVQRTPKFAAARAQARPHALTPSKLVGDTAVWTTARSDGVRCSSSRGAPRRVRRRALPVRRPPGVPAPDRPGEARHVIRLAPQRDDVYQWNTQVEHAVGRARAAQVVDALGIALSRLERPAREVRAEVGAALPRTSAALGRPLHPGLGGHGAGGRRPRGWWSSAWVVRPARVRPTLPHLAAYVDKWVTPSRYHVELVDGRGGRWLDARAGKGTLTSGCASGAASSSPLDGPARPLPDALQLRTDASVHFMLWDVGVSDMVGDLSFVRGAHERGFLVQWRRRPDWHLPLGVRHLINGTLDRPFQGSGMQLRLTLRDAEAGQTLVLRRLDVAVQESAIVRWLGALGGRAMSDFAGPAEAEENRFTADALLGLRGDLAAALGG
jgi:hypothetical protein